MQNYILLGGIEWADSDRNSLNHLPCAKAVAAIAGGWWTFCPNVTYNLSHMADQGDLGVANARDTVCIVIGIGHLLYMFANFDFSHFVQCC